MINCKISKIEERVDAEHKHNMPVGYLKIGSMLNRPKVNECLYVGSLRTSLIQEILSYDKVKTLNSIYVIEYLDVTGIFVDAEEEDNIKTFFLADGLYEIAGKKYVVGRREREIVPRTRYAWFSREKMVIPIEEFVPNWFDANSVLTNQIWSKDAQLLGIWKEQFIYLTGEFVGCSTDQSKTIDSN